MKFQLKFILGVSIMFMVVGVVMSFANPSPVLNTRVFFTFVGILGWFIGNQLAEFEERLKDLEQSQLEASVKGNAAGAAGDDNNSPVG